MIGRYFYDGEGKRVKKVTNFEMTIFVYDGAGDLVAEYSTQANPEPTTSYMTTDNLGSPRVITDKNGNVISRRDFMPFGEEITAGVGARDTNQKYSASGIDNIRQRFTGYEKDIETDLDFAQARMYKNSHGRFTSPDPLLGSASIGNPQTFNRYSYVGNNPVNVTDPSGLRWCINIKSGEGRTYNTQCPFGTTEADEKIDYNVVEGSVQATNGTANVGDKVRFNNTDNTVTIVTAGEEQQQTQTAENAGSTTQAASNPAQSQSGSPSGLGSPGSPTSPNTDGLLPLPCPDGNTCSPKIIDIGPGLDMSNVEPPKVVEGIILIARGCSFIPGLGTPCAIIAAIGEAGKGNVRGAGEDLLGIIPFGRLGKGLGKLDEVENVATHINCFTAGTLITTENGLMPIEEIEAGDKVLSYNTDTGGLEYKEVARLFRNTADEFLKIRVEGEAETIQVTLGHPFYVHRNRSNLPADADDEGDWVLSKSLRVGDLLKDKTGAWQPILSIEKVFETKATYNFEVEQNPDYFVGENGWLVHNQSIWTSNGILSKVENAFDHWKRHKSEFPELNNAKEYVEKAKNFLNNPPKGVLTKARPKNGDTLIYDVTTNTFGVKTANGTPRTLFRPKQGIKYWNKQ